MQVYHSHRSQLLEGSNSQKLLTSWPAVWWVLASQCESSRFSHSPFPRRLCKGILGRFKPQLEALWVFSIREASPSSSRHQGGSSEPTRGLLLPWTGSGSPLMVQQSFLYTGETDNPFRLLQIPVISACLPLSQYLYHKYSLSSLC